MDNNELRDAIEGTLEHTCCEDFETQATSILSLLAPILADAEKWRKVKEIAKMFDIEGCEGCPMINTNYHICGNAWCVVDALEGEGEKG